jgi:GNAT superfamily N-acetyltransferase
MYLPLEKVNLKSGEEVEAGIVVGPDAEWADRVQHLLGHKPGNWFWQNRQFLTADVGVEARFHILHRDGRPFSQILTSEHKGVGVLGHVYTEPHERGQGAASILMKIVLQQFRERTGKALFLGTTYDSSAYRIYSRLGFQSIEPLSGYMDFYPGSKQQFEADYFAAGPTQEQTLHWPHWAVASALFAAELPGVVRSAPFQLLGRMLTEGPLLAPICEHQHGGAARARVLQKPDNGAVAGMAAWGNDPLWPDSTLVDVYCHPHFWQEAESLLANLEYPQDQRTLAYTDPSCPEKRRVLEAAGFRAVATLPQWLTCNTEKSKYVDVTLLEKNLKI